MSGSFPSNFSIDFYSYDEFIVFLKNEPWFLTSTGIEEWVEDLISQGFQEPITNAWYGAKSISNETTNFREGIVAGSLNSRQRAMLLAIKDLNPCMNGLAGCDIYGLEQVTAFATRLRDVCPQFIGSEYIPNKADKLILPGVRHEDLLALSFPDNSFDVVFSNDVLEHVPDIDRALSEVHRVLRPNGVFVSTFPFCYGQYASVTKAKLVGTEITYYGEPEYHGNPVDPKGSLVFEIPGWDILDRGHSVGFKRSYVRATASKRYGYVGSETPAILLGIFEK